MDFFIGVGVILAIFLTLIGTFVAVLTLLEWYIDHRRESNPPAEVIEKRALWRDWATRRDNQCKLVGKTYGIVISAGKTARRGNMTSWDCQGVIYSVDDRITEYGDKCLTTVKHCYGLDVTDIPKPN